jgi:hypothetical protein
MQNLVGLEHLVADPIQTGDAGVILKIDGSFKVFSTGDIDPEHMTIAQVEQGRRLQALVLALSIPQVMQILFQMLDDPAIVGRPGVNTGPTH